MRFNILFIILAIVAINIMTVGLHAQDLKTPQPSPKSTVTQAVGVMDVAVTYSRPGVKGREIFGGLLPFGELWRTGANASTTIKFTDNVSLNGKAVPAGEYALFTIPGKDSWEIIISKNIGSGSSDYKQEDDVARFSVKPVVLNQPVERFTIEIANMTDNSADIVLKWDRTAVSFSMTTDTEARVMKQIDEMMANPPADNDGIYSAAARYYFDKGKDLKQALVWINKSLEISNDAFWNVRLKSQIQAGLGDYAEAITSAKEGIKQAEAADNKQYVKYNQDAIAEWEKMK